MYISIGKGGEVRRRKRKSVQILCLSREDTKKSICTHTHTHPYVSVCVADNCMYNRLSTYIYTNTRLCIYIAVCV